jgi:hypothetical protein
MNNQGDVNAFNLGILDSADQFVGLLNQFTCEKGVNHFQE